MKYFETGDSRRTYSSAGLSFNFTKWGMVGGSPQGVLATNDVQEFIALTALASVPTSNVWEIDEAGYNRKLGIKQSNAPMSWTTKDSTTASSGAQPPKPNEFVKPTVDRSQFKQPVAEAEKVVEVQPLATPEEAIKTGKTEVVVSPPPAQQSSKKAKKAE